MLAGDFDHRDVRGRRTRFATSSDMGGSAKIFHDAMVDFEMISGLHALPIKLIAAL